mmetsp:Transcript_157637/g.278223  ORF Transcript_157637/g.278223 Transcript_157637/m.278223 type:complete len:165 (-) Transcript_157637:79-573(-)
MAFARPSAAGAASRPVTVKVTHAGQKLAVSAHSSDDISSVAAELQKRTGVPLERQRLICGGRMVLDPKARLETLLPRAGGSELSMMLLAKESTSDQVRRSWAGLLRVMWEWLEVIWAIVYRFFHTLLFPSSYAGAAPKNRVKAPNGGAQPDDLARLAAAAGGGG